MKRINTTSLAKRIAAGLAVSLCALSFTGCTFETDTSDSATVPSISSSKSRLMDATELFTERDMTQSADTSQAKHIAVTDGQEITITEEGVYVIRGQASDVTITVQANAQDKIQLVLDNLSLTNQEKPCIYSKKAKKVFITLTGSNTLAVTNRFAADVSNHIDGVIFSKNNLVCNGTGSLTITSPENGIVCKDNLTITGGTYSITAASKSIEANDSVSIADGIFSLKAGTDGIHVENNDDDTLGCLYIGGGHFTVQAGDDGLHANSLFQIDSGAIHVTAREGMEGTYIQINNGDLHINAQDDGINAAHKSKSYSPTAEINGGSVTIRMGQGEGDGIDCNGDIIINGGIIDIIGRYAFDYDGNVRYNGGTILFNGHQLDSIPNQKNGGAPDIGS